VWDQHLLPSRTAQQLGLVLRSSPAANTRRSAGDSQTDRVHATLSSMSAILIEMLESAALVG
jgi:hypothetical protein